jgi:hypothetical protein
MTDSPVPCLTIPPDLGGLHLGFPLPLKSYDGTFRETTKNVRKLKDDNVNKKVLLCKSEPHSMRQPTPTTQLLQLEHRLQLPIFYNVGIFRISKVVRVVDYVLAPLLLQPSHPLIQQVFLEDPSN